jgi:hypothetical protein
MFVRKDYTMDSEHEAGGIRLRTSTEHGGRVWVGGEPRWVGCIIQKWESRQKEASNGGKACMLQGTKVEQPRTCERRGRDRSWVVAIPDRGRKLWGSSQDVRASVAGGPVDFHADRPPSPTAICMVHA